MHGIIPVEMMMGRMSWWETIKNYYITLGERYEVDPLLFVGIHVVATLLFAGSVWWIVYNKRKKHSILLPSIVAAFIFDAANIYLIIYGRNIPWWINAIVITTTAISIWMTVLKIRVKL